MYYLYHIPGKKIGVTRDLDTRVTLVQGYKEGEYEVLDQSEDIDYISDLELELQQSYGYRKDIQPYKNLFNKMKINATEQTSTFPCPLNKLKGRLMDNIGKTWQTEFGQFEINEQTIPWIVKNAKTSMFNTERCYIYNKAYWNLFNNKDPKSGWIPNASSAVSYWGGSVSAPNPVTEYPASAESNNGTYAVQEPDNAKYYFGLIRQWAQDKGIYDKGDTKTQYVKLAEEFGELGKALLQDDQPEVIDAIGDMVVVLTNLAHQRGVTIESCIKSAYDVISKRTGKMINGTFVKDN